MTAIVVMPTQYFFRFILFFYPHRPTDFSLDFTLLNTGALIIFLFPAPKTEFDFNQSTFAVDREGEQGESFTFAFADEALNIRLADEEAAGAGGIMWRLSGGFIGADMGIEEPEFVALDCHVTAL